MFFLLSFALPFMIVRPGVWCDLFVVLVLTLSLASGSVRHYSRAYLPHSLVVYRTLEAISDDQQLHLTAMMPPPITLTMRERVLNNRMNKLHKKRVLHMKKEVAQRAEREKQLVDKQKERLKKAYLRERAQRWRQEIASALAEETSDEESPDNHSPNKQIEAEDIRKRRTSVDEKRSASHFQTHIQRSNQKNRPLKYALGKERLQERERRRDRDRHRET